MTTLYVCDYCGEVIDPRDLMAQINARGELPSDGSNRYVDRQRLNVYFGHYHTEPAEPGEPSCYDRMRNAIHLIHDLGPSIEQIPTISAQAVAARRRKHKREQD